MRILLLLLFLATATLAQELKTNFDLGLGNGYLWRGQTLSTGSVVQSSAGLSYRNFSGSLWSNHDLELEETTETDFTLAYGYKNFEAGYIHYAFDGFTDTQEFYLGGTLDAAVKPAFKGYYDFDQGKGGYVVLNLSKSFSLNSFSSLYLAGNADATFDNKLLGLEGTHLYSYQLIGGLTIKALDVLFINPVVILSFPFSTESEQAINQMSFEARPRLCTSA